MTKTDYPGENGKNGEKKRDSVFVTQKQKMKFQITFTKYDKNIIMRMDLFQSHFSESQKKGFGNFPFSVLQISPVIWTN